MKPSRALVILALIAGAGAVVLARGDVRITPIVSDGRVLVSFTSRDSWTLSSRDVLQVGRELTFEYEVELRRPASLFFLFDLFDSVLARVRVSSVAKRDILMGGYNVRRMRSGSIYKSETRKEESEVKEWLTIFEKVELEPVTPLEPNVEYYVHVVLRIRPLRNFSVFSLLPFTREENAGRSEPFTYIAR